MGRWRGVFQGVWTSVAVGGLAPTLAGCLLLNDVGDIQPDDRFSPGSGRAVLLMGLGSEGMAGGRSFRVVLDEYDAEQARVTGNCWRWDHAAASLVREAPEPVQYFAFSVEPGHYAWSGFNTESLVTSDGADMPLPSVAFRAPPGRVTYVGDFILKPAGKGSKRPVTVVVLRQDLAAAKAALTRFPTLAGEVVAAEIVRIERQPAFLCTP
jgi:hypothetical protein